MPSWFMMSMTRSTACAPICRPKLPPLMVKNAGALQPLGVRQLATPRPITGAYDEPALEHGGNHGDAFSRSQNLFRNALVGC